VLSPVISLAALALFSGSKSGIAARIGWFHTHTIT
jgi:hypothetical protein